MFTLAPLLDHFRSFCLQNEITDIDRAIDYFAIFGGTGWSVDVDEQIDTLIRTKILDNYRYIHADLTKITHSNRHHHALLSALASGDRREYSAYRRAQLSRAEGEASSAFLIDAGLVRREHSEELPLVGEAVDRLHIVTPFVRFWFAVISPYYKGIKEGNFEEMYHRWHAMRGEFGDVIYEALVHAWVKQSFEKEDWITSMGSYWDASGMIDLLAQTRSGKVIAGKYLYTKTKANKSALSSLHSACARAQLEPDISLLFARGGFSSTFKKEKSPSLRLITPKHLKHLIDHLGPQDRLHYTNKRY